MSIATKRYRRKNYNYLQQQLYRDFHRTDDDSKVKFIVSRKDDVLHDRTCKNVSKISMLDSEYLSQLPENAKLCPCCNFTAIVRNSIRLGERVDVYINFLGKVGATLEDVELLLLKHGAYLKWKDFTTLQLKVHDDYWLVKYCGDSIELFHNNYIVDENGSRIFGKGFHSQAIPGERNFQNACKVMVEYTWEKHLGVEEKAQQVQNWVSLSPLSDRIAFVDRENTVSETFFKQEGIEVMVESAFSVGESGFRIMIYRIESGKEKIAAAMERLGAEVGKGDAAYEGICCELVKLLGKPVECRTCICMNA